MILVFKGRGWVVAASAIGAGVLCAVLDIRDPRWFWPVVGLSGVVDHQLGRHLAHQPGELVQDPDTGAVTELRPVHTFFWIPLTYWLYIKLALAAAFVYIAAGR